MPYPIEKKLVIAIASSALFNLEDSDRVFREQGIEAYKTYQLNNLDNTLEKGVAFPFIRRLLNLNKIFPDIEPVEVILLSKNNLETGLRVFRSIEKYGLQISRAGFLSGKSPFEYISAFNASLFLSANHEDVRLAIENGFPAGMVINSHIEDDENDNELRIGFDFDGVLVDDQAEKVYQENHDLAAFEKLETGFQNIPHNPGPLKNLFSQLSYYQKIEVELASKNPDYKRLIRTAIITARNAPSHERVVTTLRYWGVNADEIFFLGGIEKKRVLEILKPHLFFDDQLSHLESAAGTIPSVHIPFGIVNNSVQK